jgi:hypothetical protein
MYEHSWFDEMIFPPNLFQVHTSPHETGFEATPKVDIPNFRFVHVLQSCSSPSCQNCKRTNCMVPIRTVHQHRYLYYHGPLPSHRWHHRRNRTIHPPPPTSTYHNQLHNALCTETTTKQLQTSTEMERRHRYYDIAFVRRSID